MSRKWKKFGELTRKCYMDLAGLEKSLNCWDEAFEALKEAVAAERREEPEYAAELYALDEETDYEYDVQGWLEDYLDDLDMRESKEKLLEVCDELIGLFRWEEEKPSDIRFLKASALKSLGRAEEAVAFCEKWLDQEPDDYVAVAAGIYAFLEIRNMEAAEGLIRQHIHEDTECTDENDILFTAAATYYKAAGKKEEEKRIQKALDEYEEQLEELFAGFGGEDDELEFF